MNGQEGDLDNRGEKDGPIQNPRYLRGIQGRFVDEPIKRASVYKMSRVPYGAAKLCRQAEHSLWLAAGSLQ
jgi:hypothetical protein